LGKITLKQSQRLILRKSENIRKKLTINDTFKDKEEILKVLSKCKSFLSSHAPLDLKSKTNHTIFEGHLKSYIDFIDFEDIRIKEIEFDKSSILVTTHSVYSPGEFFYILFSHNPIESRKFKK
jgi:hypothetical protein